MRKFKITGMSCAACSNRIEKTISKIDGIDSCNVNLLTNTMTITGNASNELIISKVLSIGYGASIYDNDIKLASTNSEAKKIIKRLIISGILLLLLLYISIGYTMLHFPLPKLLDDNIIIALLQMILSISIIILNVSFYINGFKALFRLVPNMDSLVSLGSCISLIYSIIITIILIVMRFNGLEYNIGLSDLYYESSAMILVIIRFGKLLEELSKKRAKASLENLMNLMPQKVNLLTDKGEKIVGISDVKIGDKFIVKPGEIIPCDGVVFEGVSSADESCISGESMPLEKTIGSKVISGTINLSGVLMCEATQVGNDLTIARIIKLVNNAASTKAPIGRIADKVSGIFIPIVLGISLLTSIIWLIAGESIGFAIARGISVLVVSCPCALGLATPVAIMVGTGLGSKEGVLYKDAETLESTGHINAVVFDKTGTITLGVPHICDVVFLNGRNEDELFKLVYSLEKLSTHPLAQSVVRSAIDKNMTYYSVCDFVESPGRGVYGKIENENIYCGNEDYISSIINISLYEQLLNEYKEKGKTIILCSNDSILLGFITFFDTIRNDSKELIDYLNKKRIKTILLSGDNSIITNEIGKSLGFNEMIGNMLPELKNEYINNLKKTYKVAMVGDGINDAPSLASANVGIAISTGTDIALESADIIILNNKISEVSNAIEISKRTIRIIYENLFWAFIYNIVCIPIAAGVFIYPFGLEINPMISATAMTVSSLCVCLNALRINLHKRKNKEINKMKEFRIKGMMCKHCENRVLELIIKYPNVVKAKVDYKKGLAIIEFENDFDTEGLKNKIEEIGYKVLSIK